MTSERPDTAPRALLDLGFMDARSKLLDIAAFLDRLDRHGPADDFRLEALRAAFHELESPDPGRAKRILTLLSDPSLEPIPAAHTKGAVGAFPLEKNPDRRSRP